MASKTLLGRKIRRLRTERGQTQAQLAEQLGISGSYLNLIEHDQRAVTVPLLLKLAKVLGVELEAFNPDEETRLASELAEVFGDPLLDEANELRSRDFQEMAQVSPAACRAVLKLYQAYQDARDDARTMAEKIEAGEEPEGLGAARNPPEEVSDFLQRNLNHFPELEAAAEELWDGGGLTQDDLGGGLVSHLATLDVTVDVVDSEQARGAVRRFYPDRGRLMLSEVLAPRSRHFQLAHQVALVGLRPLLERYVGADRSLTNDDSRALARVALANYFAGAVLMPYAPFLQAARAVRYDIERLGHRFRTSFEQVCHRLTTMQRAGDRGVPFHMIRVDIAGNISKRFSASGIRFARYSGACPKWNVHAAFMTPGFIRTQLSVMPDATTYFCVARTVRKEMGGYQKTPSRFAIGLGCDVSFAREMVYADGVDLESVGAAVPVGITCRLCERTDCTQRAFPALHQRMNVDENQRAVTFYAPPPEGGD